VCTFDNFINREHAANMYAGQGEHTGFTPVASSAKMEDPEPELTTKEPISALPIRGDVEDSPLLPQLSPLPGQVQPQSKRSFKGKFPLVRQQSAPPGSMLPMRSSTPGANNPARTNNENVMALLAEFPDVQLRIKGFKGRQSRPNSGESTNSGNLDPDATAQAFRKALRTTSSNQYKRVTSLNTQRDFFSHLSPNSIYQRQTYHSSRSIRNTTAI
jgi:hypothetical protein